MIVLNSKSAMCMDKNGKYTKQKSHIARIMHFVRNGEKFKMYKIDWCEGGMQLAEMATNSAGEHDLTPRKRYIMAIIDNLDIPLVQKGLQNTGQYKEQEFCMTRID